MLCSKDESQILVEAMVEYAVARACKAVLLLSIIILRRLLCLCLFIVLYYKCEATNQSCGWNFHTLLRQHTAQIVHRLHPCVKKI